MIKIDKDIPIPEYIKTKPHSYPFAELEVGDSFFVECKDNSKRRESVRQCAAHYRKRNSPDKEFITRTNENGIRCWRIK